MPTGNEVEVTFRLIDGTEIKRIEDATEVLTFLEEYQEYVKVRHGRWNIVVHSNNHSTYYCPECGSIFNKGNADLGDYNYCPNCGTKMDL